MKRLIKLINIIVLFIVIIFSIENIVYAQVNPNFFKPSFQDPGKNYYRVTGTIIKIMTNFGIISSVLGITIIGLKTMIGSVEEKAKYKEVALPVVIGCVIIAFISIIVKVLAKVAILI